MRLQLLGTGSADGWPNPFCNCVSCESLRQTGKARAASCALIDEEILIDWGPTLANSASRFGLSLNHVRHVLFTHGHPDHLAPEFLLWRSWIDDLAPLHIYGPAHALARFDHWMDPAAPVELHMLEAGDEFTVHTSGGAVHVSAVAASHGYRIGDVFADEAILYDITAADGDRLLYATDTGPLSNATVEALRDRAFNVVLIEETFGLLSSHGTGHLDLSTLPVALDELRAVGAVTRATDVIAFHLSHHNPPFGELSLALAAVGARAVDDGTIIDTRRRQAPVTLVIGGARSGKSRFAESLAAAKADVTYLATGTGRDDDAEWAQRVAAHQARRPTSWKTVESPDAVGAIGLHDHGTLLIDCISLWLTNVLDAADAWGTDPADNHELLTRVHEEIDALVRAVEASAHELIIVTNEVGQGVVPPTYAGRLFRDLLGVTNARLADVSDHAYNLVAGRAFPLASLDSLLSKDVHE